MDQHVGRDMNEKFAGIDAASDDEAMALSVVINGCLNDQPEHMRDWFKMFSAIDADVMMSARSALLWVDES